MFTILFWDIAMPNLRIFIQNTATKCNNVT